MNFSELVGAIPEELATHPEYFRLVCEASQDLLCEYRPADNQFVWQGDLGAEILNYASGELALTPENLAEQVFPHDRELFESEWAKISQGQAADFDCRIYNRNNDPHWFRILAIPLPEAGTVGNRSLLAFRDIHRFEENTSRMAEARRLQTIETLAAGVAHEFNNNLTPIRGFIELALDYLGPEHPVSKGLETALSRVEYCTELVEQVQSYGRKSILNPRPAEIQRMLTSIVRVALSMDGERSRNIQLEQDVDPNLPEILVDHARFRRAIVHLINNSLAAMDGRGALSVRAQTIVIGKTTEAVHPGREQGNFVRIEIKDTGAGIKRENINRIFDPFFTTHNRALSRGMGLSMVQGVVAQHGGWIEIHSNEGSGTEVAVFFPVAERQAKKPEIKHDDEDTMAVLPAASVGRLLVADDEEYIRHLIAKVFGAEGWIIDEAHDNEEVLHMVEGHPKEFDLIFLDVTMPGPSAEETVEKIIELGCDARILFISGMSMEDRLEHLLVRPHIDFLNKPFSPRALLAKVDELMSTETS